MKVIEKNPEFPRESLSIPITILVNSKRENMAFVPILIFISRKLVQSLNFKKLKIDYLGSG